jgi:hypothetical protein
MLGDATRGHAEARSEIRRRAGRVEVPEQCGAGGDPDRVAAYELSRYFEQM